LYCGAIRPFGLRALVIQPEVITGKRKTRPLFT